MNTTPRSTVLSAALIAVALAGCASSPTTTAPPPPPVVPAAGELLVESLTVRGRQPQAAVVTVRAVADQDGVADRDFRVGFRLDGGGSATSLPRDPGLTSGRTWTASLPISSTTAGGVTSTDLIISLTP